MGEGTIYRKTVDNNHKLDPVDSGTSGTVESGLRVLRSR
jgi:hypothetical protein